MMICVLINEMMNLNIGILWKGRYILGIDKYFYWFSVVDNVWKIKFNLLVFFFFVDLLKND